MYGHLYTNSEKVEDGEFGRGYASTATYMLVFTVQYSRYSTLCIAAPSIMHAPTVGGGVSG